jgi:hypothetical protein
VCFDLALTKERGESSDVFANRTESSGVVELASGELKAQVEQFTARFTETVQQFTITESAQLIDVVAGLCH